MLDIDVGGFVKHILYGRPEVQSEPSIPWEIKNETTVTKDVVKSLIDNHFTGLAAYALLKGSNDSLGEQKLFLEKMVDLAISFPGDINKLHMLQLETFTQAQGLDFTNIRLAKIQRVICQGSKLWSDKFRLLAREIASSTETTPILIGYAGAIGLRESLEEFANTRRSMFFVIPDWMLSDSSYSGYELNLHKETKENVKLLPSDFRRPNKPIFVDDLVNSRSHLDLIWEKWSGKKEKFPVNMQIRTVSSVDMLDQAA